MNLANFPSREENDNYIESVYRVFGTIDDTAARTGFKHNTVRIALNRKGYTFNNPVDIEELKALHKAGHPDGTIAERLGVSRTAVGRARNSLHLRPNRITNRGAAAYDRSRIGEMLRNKMTTEQICEELGCSDSVVSVVRREIGMAKPHPLVKLAPFEERLEQARYMVEVEGASFAEVHRTTHVNLRRLRRDFPGKQWTAQQAGRHAMMIRYGEREVNDKWVQAGSTTKLTKPPLTG